MGLGLEVGVAGRKGQPHQQIRFEMATEADGYGERRFTRTDEDPATEDRLPVGDLLAEVADGDFVRSVAEAVVHSFTNAAGTSRCDRR